MRIAFYFAVYFSSIVGGFFIVATIMYSTRKAVRLDRKFFDWMDFFIGGAERFVVTTLVIFAPSYVPHFIGGWVAAKLAANWQRLDNKEVNRVGNLLALIGSVFSFAVAILAGLAIYPGALAIWK